MVLVRKTMMIDEDIHKKIIEKQSKLIKKTLKNVSYGSVINDVLRGNYKL